MGTAPTPGDASTSKFVILATTAIAPYNIDILNILFAQANSFYRFRYRKRWVSDEISTDFRKLLGGMGIVVLCSVDEKRTPLPIRRVKIDSVESSGDFLYLRFQNLDFIGPFQEGDVYQAVSRSVEQEVREKNKFLFVYPSPIHVPDAVPDSKPDEEEQWTKLIGKIGEFEGFERAVFLKLKSITDLDNEEPAAVDPTNGRYVMKGSGTYELDIIQSVADVSKRGDVVEGGVTMTASAPESHTNLVRNSATIVGKYDMLKILFRTKKRVLKTESIIALSADEKQILKAQSTADKLPTMVVEPTIELSIRSSPSLRWIVPLIGLGLFIAALGTALGQSSFDLSRVLESSFLGAVGVLMSAYLGLRYLSEE